MKLLFWQIRVWFFGSKNAFYRYSSDRVRGHFFHYHCPLCFLFLGFQIFFHWLNEEFKIYQSKTQFHFVLIKIPRWIKRKLHLTIDLGFCRFYHFSIVLNIILLHLIFNFDEMKFSSEQWWWWWFWFHCFGIKLLRDRRYKSVRTANRNCLKNLWWIFYFVSFLNVAIGFMQMSLSMSSLFHNFQLIPLFRIYIWHIWYLCHAASGIFYYFQRMNSMNSALS